MTGKNFLKDLGYKIQTKRRGFYNDGEGREGWVQRLNWYAISGSPQDSMRMREERVRLLKKILMDLEDT